MSAVITAGDGAAPTLRRRFVLLLAAVSLICGFALYTGTLSASYSYDDIDHLNAAADVLSGRAAYWPFVFRPHL